MSEDSLFVISLILGPLLWWIPPWLAHRKGRRWLPWLIYSVCIWIVAMIHILLASPNAERLEERKISKGDMRACPFCAEPIRATARICRFCRSDII